MTSNVAGRALVDTSGHTHRILDPSSVPALASTPPGYVAQPLRWDEHTGVASRAYLHEQSTLTLRYGPPAALTPGPNSLVVIDHSTVRDHPANVYGFGRSDRTQRMLMWTVDSRHALSLKSNSVTGAIDLPALQALANGVR